MTRAVHELAVLAGLLGALTGCGGGESGPRGGSNSGAGGTGTMTPTTPTSLRTVAYMPSYRGQLSNWSRQLEFHNMTYVNLSFVEVDEAGNIRFPDPGLPGFVASAQAAGAKVCVALGGATTIDTGGVFSTLLQDAQRPAFVDKLVAYTLDNKLDCLDIDLEGNGVNQYYEAFVTTLATKLHEKQKEMTSAVSSWFGDKITDKAIAAFDFINVMAYDLHNPGGSAQPVQSSSVAESKAEVDYWVNRGLPKDKAVFGVPFYGYSWANDKSTALTYAEILARDASAATRDQVTLNGSPTFLNSRSTIIEKAKLAKEYGGIMVWELGQDAPGDASLLKAIADATP